MKTVGIPKEIKCREFRVAMTPNSTKALIECGAKVLVEAHAGDNAGFTDQDYVNAGCTIAPDAKTVFAEADIIIKVKEPQPSEFPLIKRGQILYTFFHFASNAPLAKGMVESGATCIAYEHVAIQRGVVPCLRPMSQVAGKLAAQQAANLLEKSSGGPGMLLGGAAGVPPAKALVIGAGVVGSNCAKVLLGLGADVTIMDVSVEKLVIMEDIPGLKTCLCSTDALMTAAKESMVVVGSVFIPGTAAPKLVTREMLRSMPAGACFIDVSIDQGGCGETSRATTHENPTYVEEGILHYCVANTPALAAKTSTQALNSGTLRYAKMIVSSGLDACRTDPDLRAGLIIHDGCVVDHLTAKALGYPLVPFE